MKAREIGSVVLGRYRIDKLAYSGNMSNVYKVYDQRLRRSMCLKEMSAGQGTKKDILRYNALIKEADIVRQLSYTNIPRVTEFFLTDDNIAIYIMDWVDGITTQDILRQQGVIPLNLISRWGIELCKTLGYLHGSKTPLVYRDLKPSNVMIEGLGTPSEKLYLIDFGASEVITEDNQVQSEPIGTPGYAHPDQKVRGAAYSTAWDIHALGVLLFVWYTGHSPVRKVTRRGRVFVDYLESYDINLYSEQTNDALRDIILKCTSVPMRYRIVEEVQRDLEHLTDDTEANEHKAHRAIRASIALLVAGCLITVSGIGSLAYAQSLKADKISSERQQAVSLNTPQSYVTYLNDAPKDIDGYLRLVRAQTADGVFSDSDAHTLTNLIASNLDDLKKSPQYPALAQAVGEAYFYYYSPLDKISNYQLALQWLNQAEGIKSKKLTLEVLISTFQSNIQANITAGSDAGKYIQFYKQLTSTDLTGMSPLIQAMYYRTLSGLIGQYAYQLKQDGATQDQLTKSLDDAQNFANQSKDTSTRVSSLISDINAQIPSARTGIEQVYSGRDGV